MMNKYFGRGLALDFIRDTLADAETIRIATAFFEPSGFQLLSGVLSGKNVRILIGRDYGPDDGIQTLLGEFMDGLLDGSLENRMEAMLLLQDSLSSGRIVAKISKEDTPFFIDARQTFHHAKLYIADENACVVCSSNMTWTGLVHAREAGYLVRERGDVRYFVDKFDEYFDGAESLTEALLERLREWLALYSPYTVYIRSLLNIYGLPESSKITRLPVLSAYQVPVVSRLLKIEREMWDRMLSGIRIRYKEYSYNALSSDDWKKNRIVRELEHELHEADEKTFILIDESHHLRNEEASGGSLRLRNERIIETVKKGCYVLLMTATPYSRGVEDINAQLKMLPETSQSSSLFGADRWKVDSPGQLSEFPAGVVLTAPTVVQNFSHEDENKERYVLFSGDQKRYFPRSMRIHTVTYMNRQDVILIDLLEKRLLHVENNANSAENGLFEDMEDPGRRDALQEARFIHQFCSSVSEVDQILHKMAKTNDQSYEKIRFADQEALTREIDELRNRYGNLLDIGSDHKMEVLLEILERHKNEKVLIFCVYQNTAKYLQASLKKKNLNCETTVDKDPDRVDHILRRFAPIANEVRKEDPDYEETMSNQIDILIATGSLTEGFNLQDASVLVNFDLPWTVLVLAQRMGRILRPWMDPRSISIYNLIPDTMQKKEFYLAVRWKDRLMTRNRELKSFSDLPVLHEDSESEDVEMISLAGALQKFSETEMSLEDVLSFIENSDHLYTSSFLKDLSMISGDFADDILKLPEGFSSVREMKQKGIYILFKYNRTYYPVFFDENGGIQLNSESADKIMNLIRCSKESEAPYSWTAEDRKRCERLLENCKTAFSMDRGMKTMNLKIDCFIYLVPLQDKEKK